MRPMACSSRSDIRPSEADTRTMVWISAEWWSSSLCIRPSDGSRRRPLARRATAIAQASASGEARHGSRHRSARRTRAGRTAPVVALESTLICHGLPRPRNLELARAVEAAVLAEGRPAGHDRRDRRRITVGLDAPTLERLAHSRQCRQVLAARSGAGRGAPGARCHHGRRHHPYRGRRRHPAHGDRRHRRRAPRRRAQARRLGRPARARP